MLLAADVQRALQAMRRAGQRGGGVADAVLVAVEDEMALAQGLDHVEHRFESSYSTIAAMAALRAVSRLSAATARTICPTYSTLPSASSGSPATTGPMSNWPGTSAAVRAMATPGNW